MRSDSLLRDSHEDSDGGDHGHIVDCHLPGADEITHRFVRLIGHPDCGQFTALSSRASCSASRRLVFTRSSGLRRMSDDATTEH
jgi:hypothetical protein